MRTWNLLSFETSLRHELKSRDALSYLQFLQAREELYAEHRSWASVLKFMHDQHSSADLKNKALAMVITNIGGQYHEVECNALLAMFMPALRGMAGRTNYWDKNEPEELAATLIECFYQATIWLRKSIRCEHLSGALMRQTHHYLYEQYANKWKTRSRNKLMPHGSEEEDWRYEALGYVAEDPEFNRVEQRHACEACIAHLHKLQRMGVISSEDRKLIVGTYLSSQSVNQYANSWQLNPEACKKRRQRALAKITSYLRNNPNRLSPNSA